ncbi:NAD(P)-binding protein [Curtanaerobium respiraculi]|uniref:NAD(P)-binding protein n=1 Tax=Curtanaerobium respiraculi TaxID=2949669 RepID=UPI0024B3AC2D|nr:NAD(P)-binding protein [Curtanaerobium respiraculi]
MAFDHKTIIVGAGAAGMNCALDLQKADHDYLLIADYMGGRICNDTSMQLVMSLIRFDFDADGMTERLSQASGNVLLGNLVTKVEKAGEGWKVTTMA